MKNIRIILRILLGLVFIFSGFVKGIDPLGSAIKFSEYFEVFHLAWLDSLSLFLSILLSAAEFLIGVALLIGLRMRVTAWASLIFMVFFTLLTLYSAIANPVSDCGCFGDAIKLSNWGTFYKNLVLISFAISVFLFRNEYKPYAKASSEWALVILFALGSSGLFYYCYEHLPLIDFLPYNTGTHIPSKIEIPADAPGPKFLVKLYYRKDGVTKEFTIDNYPQDSSWTFVDTKSEMIEEGYVPPIQNFGVFTANGEDITSQLLTDTVASFVFISPDITKIKKTSWQKINKLHEFSLKNNNHFYFITGSPQEIVNNVFKTNKKTMPYYFMDVTTLKTIVRSNPGLILLKDGVILGKWHYNDFPEFTGKKVNLGSYVLNKYVRTIEIKNVFVIAFILLLILTILFFTRKEKAKK